jgi:hypothetical protein
MVTAFVATQPLQVSESFDAPFALETLMVVWACLVQERVLKVAAEQAFPDVESVGEAVFGCKQLWCVWLHELLSAKWLQIVAIAP